MTKILSPLLVEYIGKNDEERFRLHENFVIHSKHIGELIIPKDFEIDFASVPRVPLAYWLTGGKAKIASVPHDYICKTKIFPRAIGDKVFLEFMEYTKVPSWRKSIMYGFVRAYAIVTGKDSDYKKGVANVEQSY